ncbi:hypothetical protein Zmor_006095 [Zophobas morio]|uniref:Uncharacterized protein n=1 Tax=Zophobas morio TaxID=2755281 RepID=A0AA38IPI9_9CUCU|nr:hypothetical protein Zmor_006095 [Zophobas morio]
MFWFTHMGHTPDLEHCNLSKMERAIITSKLAKGVTLNRILDDTVSTDTENFSRVHLLTKKDLNNLQNQIPSSANWKKHQNDAISVSTWVESMSHLGEDNPVIYFKNQGECDTENILLKG